MSETLDYTPDSVIASMRILASAMAGRADLATKAGKTFDGVRDVYAVCGYKKDLTPSDYRERYERDGVAARIVDAFPNSCWLKGGKVFEKQDETETPFEKAWTELDKKLKVWPMFRRADQLAGLGRYAVILIGAPGEVDQPLEKCSLEQLMYLMTYSEEDAVIDTYDEDFKSPRFGRPTFYNIRRTMISTSGQQVKDQKGKRVHYTRVIHVADNLLDHHTLGRSRLKNVWNLLDDLQKVVAGGAEAFWKRADGGMQLDLDPGLRITETGKDAMNEQLVEYTHGLSRILKTRGVSINRLGSDVADFRGPSAAIIDLLSASTGIPQRILMGSERGQLASTQDKSNWDERVQSRRTDFCESQVVCPFVDRMIELGALPQPGEDGYKASWPESEELDELQKADLANKLANLNKTQGETIVTADEIRTQTLGLEPFTPEQLAKIEEDKQAKAEAAQAAAAAEPKFAEWNGGAGHPDRALALALHKAMSTLQTPELRAAVQRDDVDEVKRLLDAATDEFERAVAS
jgi:hypothetical protein